MSRVGQEGEGFTDDHSPEAEDMRVDDPERTAGDVYSSGAGRGQSWRSGLENKRSIYCTPEFEV